SRLYSFCARELLLNGRRFVARREAPNEFFAKRNCADRFIQHFGEETDLVKQAVLMLWIQFLRNRILIQRLFRLPRESKRVPEIGVNISVINPARDRFLISADRFRPPLMIVCKN